MAVQKELAEEFGALARGPLLSRETVDGFLPEAAPGQVAAAAGMLRSERELRRMRKRERMFGKAKLPSIKPFGGHGFSQVALPEGYAKDDPMGLGFVAAAQGFVLRGQTGRGKTHLAVAIGAACTERGVEVRFFAAAELTLPLLRAKGKGQLKEMLQDLARRQALIPDELGYVPPDMEGSRLLFRVMGDCYERRSLVITTNMEFSKWGTVFGDDKTASAIIDRIVHHGRLVELNGPSHRMDAALMLGKQDSWKEKAVGRLLAICSIWT